ncbi:unnamed protein product [Adineta steineri]|uniref:Uncharacterized protein n=1 Tax=Adineta steineri TaxID=433720 RepID=A0A815PVN1_9BILA|nr:unnamed protein product [Adineta steineri]CAF4242374.1 unnamed protein product [Adineta steineri]
MKNSNLIVAALIFASIFSIDAFVNPPKCLLSSNIFQCLVNPCLQQTCSSLTPGCISNFCGGCYFSLLEENGSPNPDNLGQIKDTAPASSKDYGRFKKPLPVVDFSWVSPALCNFVTEKNWHFISISTPQYFIVSTIINLNYIVNVFVYVYDITNGDLYNYTTNSILAVDIKERTNSSISGCTVFNRSSSEYVSHCYNQQENRYEINVNVTTNNSIQVSFAFRINYSSVNDQSLVLLYPFKPTQPAYTHHLATQPTQGTMKIGNILPESSFTGLSTTDWTLAYQKRVTRWKWASFSVIAHDITNGGSVTIGINLSNELYDDKNNISMENTIWINGQVYTIDDFVNIETPSEQFLTTQPWYITTVEDNPTIDLQFQPMGSHQEHDNLAIVDIQFVQAFGFFNGTIKMLGNTYNISNGWGVVESNYAKW